MAFVAFALTSRGKRKAPARARPKSRKSDPAAIAPSRRAISGAPAGQVQAGARQTKLEIGPPNDNFEQEADRVADQVMRMPDSAAAIQRQCSECETDEQIQTKAAGRAASAPAVSPGLQAGIGSLRGSGRPLSAESRSFFEPRFGQDFSSVRVHADARAASAARALEAQAFTVGSDLFFAQGRFRPDMASGKRLLAHELTHTIQQQGPRTALARQRIQRLPDGDEATCDAEAPTMPAVAEWYADPLLAKIRADPPGANHFLLAFGAVGPAVELVQQALAAWGCDQNLGHLLPQFRADGIFGSETRGAVETFQGQRGIDVDGLVGPITMGELDTVVGSPIVEAAIDEIAAPDEVTVGEQVPAAALTVADQPASPPVTWQVREGPPGTVLQDTQAPATFLSAPAPGQIVLAAFNPQTPEPVIATIFAAQSPAAACTPTDRPTKVTLPQMGSHPAHVPHCGDKIQPEVEPSGAQVCWSLEDGSTTPDASTTIDANTGEVTIGDKQSAGSIRVRANGPGTFFQNAELFVRSHPTGIQSTSVTALSSSSKYGAKYDHVFTSNDGNASSLEGVAVGERFPDDLDDPDTSTISRVQSTLGKPFLKFKRQVLADNPSGTTNWLLSNTGNLGEDKITMPRDQVNVQAILGPHELGPASPPFATSLTIKQDFHWYCRTRPSTNRWTKFHTNHLVRTLEVDTSNAVALVTASNSKKESEGYTGHRGVFNVEANPKSPVKASPAGGPANTVQISADTAPSGGELRFKIISGKAATGSTIHNKTGVLTVGTNIGTVVVEVRLKSQANNNRVEIPIEIN